MQHPDIQFLKANAPCYVYDKDRIIEQCLDLKKTFPSFEFLYSFKTNPFSGIIETIHSQGFGCDAASAAEVHMAINTGISPEMICYSTPGKTERDIESTLGKCILIADSIGELWRIETLAAAKDQTVNIGLRINPSFSMGENGGCASKFGIDEEQLPVVCEVLAQCSHIHITGLHVHIRSQVLEHTQLADYYKKCFQLAQRMNDLPGICIDFINFGSGIGAVYDSSSQRPVDLEALYMLIKWIVRENQRSLRARLLIETCRFIVCNAGTYYTPISDIKTSHGKTYLIVSNGLNGFLRPAIASLLQKCSNELPAAGLEPLYTCANEFSVEVLNDACTCDTVSIVGNLCTALDIICEDVHLKHAQIGDIVAISNAGSYGYSLSPLLFSSHDIPQQFLIHI